MNKLLDPVIHDLNQHIAEQEEAEEMEARAEQIANDIACFGYKEGGIVWDVGDVISEVIYENEPMKEEFIVLISTVASTPSNDDRQHAAQLLCNLVNRASMVKGREIAEREKL